MKLIVQLFSHLNCMRVELLTQKYGLMFMNPINNSTTLLDPTKTEVHLFVAVIMIIRYTTCALIVWGFST